jgi:hypothetical protein
MQMGWRFVGGVASSGMAGLLLSAALLAAQQTSLSRYHDPVDLVRTAVQNEIKASNNSSSRCLFRGVKTNPRGSTTKLYVETKEATAGMIVGYDGKALTPEQRRDELARVDRFLRDPAELRKKQAQERETADRSLRITRALPDAFLYEYAGEEQGSEGIGRVGEPLVKLSFRPNPNYDPPSRVEEVLRGMQGFVLVDAAHGRLASIDGTLFKDVGFGWGILGHLDRGGRVVLHQQWVEGDLWQLSSVSFKVTGKILLIKSFASEATEVFSGFRKVPSDLTFAQGLELLKKEATAEDSGSQSGQRDSKK